MHRTPRGRLAGSAVCLIFVGANLTPLSQDGPPPAKAPSDDIAKLFVANCAPCHGESGDGKGTTELDRPARSFLDGGFSYGNTRSAIYRSLTYGIPGTPMPAAESALTEEQRWAMADYVISLTPERRESKAKDRVLEVTDRARVVRGYLPPITDGAPETTRGLLVGMPSGTTFEYTLDDVRLLGVRQGGFVERKDWEGRGGAPLKPLGKLTLVNDAGEPRSTFSGKPGLRVVLKSTVVDDVGVQLRSELVDAQGAELASVIEGPLTIRTSLGVGVGRSFTITAPQPLELGLHPFQADGQADVAGGGGRSGLWTNYEARKLEDGTWYVLMSHHQYEKADRPFDGDPGDVVHVTPGQPSIVNCFAFVLEGDPDAIIKTLMTETKR